MTKQPYRIVFLGTPEFAVPSLQALLDHGENVVCVVTQPDRPKGRGRKLTAPPVKELALQADIPVLQPTKIRTEEFREAIAAYKPDLMVVTAYGRILPGPLLSLPRLGTFNVHGSLLPNYRGAAPSQWALINKEAETGVTIMQMDEGLDTGDMLLPAAIPIDPADTTATLAPKLAALGGEALVRALDLLKEGKLPPIKQDDNLATLAPPLTKDQGVIDWNQPATAISGLIHGLDPWPTASSSIDNKRFKLFASTVVPGTDMPPPGTLCAADKNGLLIATNADFLLVHEIQMEGARRMPVEVFLNGRCLPIGKRFE